MQILFVEDNKTFASALISSLKKNIPNLIITHVASRDAALSELKTSFFDLIILDLSIPSTDSSLAVAPECGQEVFYAAQDLCNGTPIYILTGSNPDEFTTSLIRKGENLDIWGVGKKTPTIDHKSKDKANLLINELKEIEVNINITNKIGIDTRGKQIQLKPEYKRALRVFTRQHKGDSCSIYELDGGLSDAKVLRVAVHNDQGNIIALTVAKLGLSQVIQKEFHAYDRHVKLLGISKFPPLLYIIEKGLRGYAGIFYSLAEDYQNNFFDVFQNRLSDVPQVISALRSNLERWSNAKVLSKTTVREIRRKLLSDEDFDNFVTNHSLSHLNEIENMELKAYASCIHGDLHGGNILISSSLQAVLIDFGNVGIGPSCLDPITLELSLLFHPDASNLKIFEILKNCIEHWPNEEYLEKDGCLDAIKALREWAYDLAGSDLAFFATGYAFAIRQLKYPEINSEVTLKLIESIVIAMRSKLN